MSYTRYALYSALELFIVLRGDVNGKIVDYFQSLVEHVCTYLDYFTDKYEWLPFSALL